MVKCWMVGNIGYPTLFYLNILATTRGVLIIISTMSNHNLALIDGAVWSWGLNSYGQLGVDSPDIGEKQKVPARFVNLVGVASVAAGKMFSLILSKNGFVYIWGWDS